MPLSDQLKGYWSLNNTLAEDHNGYTLGNNGPVSLTGTGLVYANAADFEIDGFLWVADNADLSSGNVDFSFALWLNRETDIQEQYIGSSEAGGVAWNAVYSTANGRFRVRACSASGFADDTFVEDGGGFGGGNAPALSTWYLLAGGHDAANNVLWVASSVNSLTIYETAYSAGVWDSAGEFQIGRSGPSFPQLANATIGPVMFWKRRLTADDLTALYNGGAGLTYAALTAGAAAGYLLVKN